MATIETAPGPNQAGRMVLGFVAFALVVMFVASFVYRLERPSLEVRQERQGGMGGQAMSGPMKEIMELMQKLQQNPDDPALQLAMAERFMSMGAYERAKVFLDKLAKSRPDDPEVQNALGVTLYNLKDLDGAKAAFEGMLARDPNNYQARFNLGLLYKYALNQPEKAAEAFKAVMANPRTDPKTREAVVKELEGKPSP